MDLLQMIEHWELTHGVNTLKEWCELSETEQQKFIFETLNNTIKRLSNKIDSLNKKLDLVSTCPTCGGSMAFHPLDHKPDCPFNKPFSYVPPNTAVNVCGGWDSEHEWKKQHEGVFQDQGELCCIECSGRAGAHGPLCSYRGSK